MTSSLLWLPAKEACRQEGGSDTVENDQQQIPDHIGAPRLRQQRWPHHLHYSIGEEIGGEVLQPLRKGLPWHEQVADEHEAIVQYLADADSFASSSEHTAEELSQGHEGQRARQHHGQSPQRSLDSEWDLVDHDCDQHQHSTLRQAEQYVDHDIASDQMQGWHGCGAELAQHALLAHLDHGSGTPNKAKGHEVEDHHPRQSPGHVWLAIHAHGTKHRAENEQEEHREDRVPKQYIAVTQKHADHISR